MKGAIRCCISCILPCGALDVIRIVHVNGRVEEITGTIYAAQILKAHPKHILKKPTTKPVSDDSDSAHQRPAIVVVPPEAQLQRGKIYFLIPEAATCTARIKRKEKQQQQLKKVGNKTCNNNKTNNNNNNNNINNNNKDHDKYLSEILSEKGLTSQRERRRGRVAVWRPHLESITETFNDASSTDKS